jgi:N-methylhydantoinase B/oxoprolinase/acetone carboxylase alpha subunit
MNSYLDVALADAQESNARIAFRKLRSRIYAGMTLANKLLEKYTKPELIASVDAVMNNATDAIGEAVKKLTEKLKAEQEKTKMQKDQI